MENLEDKMKELNLSMKDETIININRKRTIISLKKVCKKIK